MIHVPLKKLLKPVYKYQKNENSHFFLIFVKVPRILIFFCILFIFNNLFLLIFINSRVSECLDILAIRKFM